MSTENSKILIIDDELSIRRTIQKILRNKPYTLFTAENGLQGLNSLKEHQPDLIILDLMMPSMNGIQFLEAIQLKPTDPYAVIILTGNCDDQEMNKCYELGTHFFLKKPFGFTEFSCLVKRCLELKKLQNDAKSYSGYLEKSVQDQSDYISKLSVALDNSGSFILMTNKTGEAIYANMALLEKTGFKLKDIHAKSLKDLPLFDETTKEKFLDAVKNSSSLKGEVISIKKDGSKLLTNSTFLPVRDKSGDVSNYLCILDDISMIIEAELAKEQAHKVYLENQIEKENFKNNISHELLTPLHVISTSAILLAEKGKTAELQKYISFIQQSASDLHDLVERILNLKIIQNNQMPIRQSHFTIVEIFNDLCSLHKASAQKKGLDLSSNIFEDLPQSVIGDEVRLRQILSYLLSNAIKFTKSGQVKLSARLKSKEKGQHILVFEVSDSGIGIDPAMMNSIFDLYIQGDNTNARHYSGLGLGLTLVQELVHSLHGKINIDSVVNQGSVFSITLPFNAP